MKKTEQIVEVMGIVYKTAAGSVVHMSLNKSRKTVGDMVCFAPVKSTKNIRFRAGNTQWIESKAIGPVFNKEV